MVVRHRGWRAWLAVVSAGLTGTATIVLGPGPAPGVRAATAGIAAETSASGGGATVSPPGLLAAVAERRTAEFSTAAPGEHGRHRGQRALGADANGGQVQLPGGGAPPDAQPAVMPRDTSPRLLVPAWRSLLESRWQQRLGSLTEMSVAYHDARERASREQAVAAQPAGGQIRQLLGATVDARRALLDTEEALARLTAGRYGQCEQCTSAISLALLTRQPEVRYCGRCAPAAQPEPAPGESGLSSA